MLGADQTWSPERVADLLGGGYGENIPSKYAMWRDHGLAEFFWQRSIPRGPWEGTHFSVQAHRLAARDSSLVNPLIQKRYGPFDGPIALADVTALLSARGVELTEVPYKPDPDEIRTFWQPASRTLVYVVAGEYYGRAGDVYKVVNPSNGTP